MGEAVLQPNADGGTVDDDRSFDRPKRRPIGKWGPSLLSIAMIGAVLSPIAENWRQDPRDNFPLSYYPMFSLRRAETSRLSYPVGFDARGNRYQIPYTLVGAGGLNQVRRQITKIVEGGRAADLCLSVGSRVARRTTRPLADVVRIQIATGTYRLSDYFTGKDKTPVVERVHASCDVRRGTR